MVKFRRCPHCQGGSWLSWLSIYRCQVCYQLCCDRCLRRTLFGHYCPHCGARSSVEKVGIVR